MIDPSSPEFVAAVQEAAKALVDARGPSPEVAMKTAIDEFLAKQRTELDARFAALAKPHVAPGKPALPEPSALKAWQISNDDARRPDRYEAVRAEALKLGVPVEIIGADGPRERPVAKEASPVLIAADVARDPVQYAAARAAAVAAGKPFGVSEARTDGS